MDEDNKTPEEQDEIMETSGLAHADEGQVGEGSTLSLSGMFREYWIDYASDVILDRSVPDIDDGLKPVQ